MWISLPPPTPTIRASRDVPEIQVDQSRIGKDSVCETVNRKVPDFFRRIEGYGEAWSPALHLKGFCDEGERSAQWPNGGQKHSRRLSQASACSFKMRSLIPGPLGTTSMGKGSARLWWHRVSLVDWDNTPSFLPVETILTSNQISHSACIGGKSNSRRRQRCQAMAFRSVSRW